MDFSPEEHEEARGRSDEDVSQLVNELPMPTCPHSSQIAMLPKERMENRHALSDSMCMPAGGSLERSNTR